MLLSYVHLSTQVKYRDTYMYLYFPAKWYFTTMPLCSVLDRRWILSLRTFMTYCVKKKKCIILCIKKSIKIVKQYRLFATYRVTLASGNKNTFRFLRKLRSLRLLFKEKLFTFFSLTLLFLFCLQSPGDM